jgi:GNAT superfamily N-acetyltransferase
MNQETLQPKFADVTLTFLEMHDRPSRSRPLPDGAVIRRLESPTVDSYRALYNGVGGQWHWADRRLINDDDLRREITHPLVDIIVLDVAGDMAGYAELDRRKWPDLQIAYFGLMPAFIGRGLGGGFLDAILERAWDLGPSRVWLHTCSLDHPAALPMYRSAGFSEFGTEARKQRLLDPATDPRNRA